MIRSYDDIFMMRSYEVFIKRSFHMHSYRVYMSMVSTIRYTWTQTQKDRF